MTTPTLPTVDPRQRNLGRLYAPDTRDRQFELTDARMRLIPRAQPRLAFRKLPWRLGPSRYDQGDTSECTVHAGAHCLEAAPRVHALGWDRPTFTAMYEAAQDVDEWPGTKYDGTSFRAVCKVLAAQGYINSYLWAFDEDTAREYLTTRGPLCFGSEWFAAMFDPNAAGYVEPRGALAGGHEYLVRWYYGPRHYRYPDTYECLNSWGPSWGLDGRFFLKADAFRYLFTGLNGDLCLPTEVARDVILST